MKKNVAWQALNSQHPVLRVKKEKKITAADKGTWPLEGAAGWVEWWTGGASFAEEKTGRRG